MIDRIGSLAASVTHEIERVAGDTAHHLERQFGIFEEKMSTLARQQEIANSSLQVVTAAAQVAEARLMAAIGNSHAPITQLQISLDDQRMHLADLNGYLRKGQGHLTSLIHKAIIAASRKHPRKQSI